MFHTFWVSNLRFVLDVVLNSGKQHISGHGKAAMGRLLDELDKKSPALMRGKCGYCRENIIDVFEQRYLLRLRKTANIKRLIERLSMREDWMHVTMACQGWQAIEDVAPEGLLAHRRSDQPANHHRQHFRRRDNGGFEAESLRCSLL